MGQFKFDLLPQNLAGLRALADHLALRPPHKNPVFD